MQDNIIDMIESTPKLKSQKCRIISYTIYLGLKFTTYITTLLTWLLYDYFIAFFILILSFIVMGIVRSKIRNIAIPTSQQEYKYNDKSIADWYTAKELCYVDELLSDT